MQSHLMPQAVHGAAAAAAKKDERNGSVPESGSAKLTGRRPGAPTRKTLAAPRTRRTTMVGPPSGANIYNHVSKRSWPT